MDEGPIKNSELVYVYMHVQLLYIAMCVCGGVVVGGVGGGGGGDGWG